MSDYFGLPTGVGNIQVNSFFHRCYNLCWNSWFRDQNLTALAVVRTGDGPDYNSDYTVLKRMKRHDYFTSCLPWPQRGGEAVNIPLGTVAPVVGIGKENSNFPLSNVTVRETGGSGTVVYKRAAGISGDYTGNDHKFVVSRDEKNTAFPAIFADLSDASAYDINTLRFSFQVQRYLERAARGGSRYVEMVRSHFGVVCPDLTYRPEFLGGGTAPIIVTPVAQTSESGTTPQGNLSAFATCVTSGNGFTKSFTEHGFVMGIINVSADLTYQQGVPRMFSRDTILDYYFPVFANLGEQAVLNQEIYAQGYVKSPMAAVS